MDYTIYQVIDIVGALGVTKYDAPALALRSGRDLRNLSKLRYDDSAVMALLEDFASKGEVSSDWKNKIPAGGLCGLLGLDEDLVTRAVGEAEVLDIGGVDIDKIMGLPSGKHRIQVANENWDNGRE